VRDAARRLSWSFCLPALAAAAALLAIAVPLHAAQRVTFRTDDGVTLTAMWYEPSNRPGPAVILIHMLQRSRRDWEPLAQRLASDGIGALAIDLRGHGESSGQAPSAAEESATFASLLADVRAARRFLATRSDVQQTRVGIAGASLGASLAVLHAAADPTVSSLALLSPSLDYRGLRIETAARKLAKPVLLVASDDDFYASRSARELQKGAGTREVLTVSRAGHGTNMLTHAPDLVRALIDWFRRTL
jgi:dienelactone hydrolase